MLCEGWRAFYYYFSSRVFLFFFPLVPVLFSAFCGWEVDGVGFLLFQVWEYFCPSEGPKLGECGGGGGGGGVCVCVCVWAGRVAAAEARCWGRCHCSTLQELRGSRSQVASAPVAVAPASALGMAVDWARIGVFTYLRRTTFRIEIEMQILRKHEQTYEIFPSPSEIFAF